MHDTQTQIDRLIELAIVQRTELKQLVEQLPELREHLNAEIEKVFDEVEPQLRVELEDWTAKQTADQTAKLGASLEAKINELAKALEVSTQARYSAILAEREKNFALAAEAEAKIAEHAASLPEAVKGIVDAELARFPRAGEIDQLRKEFAEPKSLNPRGKWKAGVAYNKLDLVTLNGDSYTSAKDDNRTRPSRSSADWTLVAARGTGGGGGPTSLTDLTAVPQNGELLIGNGSAFVNNTLTAGTGVTITNGAGTITIDATGAQEILTATVKNAESVAITKGQVVYLFSATGGFPSVKLAYNTTDATSAKTFGVVSSTSISPNGTGTVTCVGVVDGLNLGTYSDGDTLYLGATPGSVTATKPYAPNHLVYVGIIERANAGNGELYVRVQNGYELDEIHDVQIITPPAAGAVLVRDATNSLWKAAQIAGTANQITVTNADAAVTLSIPTNPTLNGNLTVTGTGKIGATGAADSRLHVYENTAVDVSNGLTIEQAGTGDSVMQLLLTGVQRWSVGIDNSDSDKFKIGTGTLGSADKLTLDTSGNLTVSGTGTSDFSGNVRLANTKAIYGYTLAGATGALISSTSSNNLNVGQNNANWAALNLFGGTGNVDVYSGATGFVARFNTAGNVLLGTPTDSGNGRIQLATHTTSAGGIGFGTDTALFRSSAGILSIGDGTSTRGLIINGAAANAQVLLFQQAGTEVARIGLSASTSLVFATGANVTALTLDSSQNATFSGDIRFSATNTFDVGATGARVRQLFVKTPIISTSTPASASATGTEGTIVWDTSYIYVCTAANTWKRVSIATWP